MTISRSFKQVAAALALAVAPAVLAQAPLKIGFMAELSGPQGAIGQDQYDAFMMIVQANGGRLGGVPHRRRVDAGQPASRPL